MNIYVFLLTYILFVCLLISFEIEILLLWCNNLLEISYSFCTNLKHKKHYFDTLWFIQFCINFLNCLCNHLPLYRDFSVLIFIFTEIF